MRSPSLIGLTQVYLSSKDFVCIAHVKCLTEIITIMAIGLSITRLPVMTQRSLLYNESNLARLVAQIRRVKETDYARIIDFESYAPSYGATATFIAAPIFDRSKFIGVLAVQLPVDEINNLTLPRRMAIAQSNVA